MSYVLPFQKDHAEFTNQNNELKFRIHAMEQQTQLRDGIKFFVQSTLLRECISCTVHTLASYRRDMNTVFLHF